MTVAPAWGRDFRCAGAAVDRGDDLAGTATNVRAFLLLEQDGGWGTSVLGDSDLPDDVRRHLRGHGPVKVLLVRGHHRHSRNGRRRAFVALPAAGVLLTRELDDPADLLALDMAALARGQAPDGWSPHAEPMYLACTHGRHDVCCAERGRPAAAGLAEARPEQAWEVSHLGGDRFAGNVLVLPEGLYYGRVDRQSAAALPDLHEAGLYDLERLRGSTTLPMWLQAADIALRRHLGRDRRDAVRLLDTSAVDRLADEGATARFAVAPPASGDGPDATWRVTLRRTTTGEAALTCGSVSVSRVPQFHVVALLPD